MEEGKCQQGFTLIEVLIAVLVFAIGLLGLAGLQTSGLRTTHNSYLLALATQQAEDMAERMRANPTQTRDNGYFDVSTVSVPASKPTPDCTVSECTAAQLAIHDHYAWVTRNSQLFSMPGVITRENSGQQPVYTITIPWSVLREDGTATNANKNFTMVFFP